MRLLRSYCNRERATAHLKKTLAQARSESITRPGITACARKGPQRLSAETNAAIVADYEAGMRCAEIARKHGINEWTVWHRLRRAGVTLRPNSMDDEQIELAHALRADGLSYNRIAERVGFSASTVRNVLKRPLPETTSRDRRPDPAA